MFSSNKQMYAADRHVAEIYDQVETQTDDVSLIRRLIGPRRNLSIFEPLCGNGRIAIPLARDGHQLIGLDEAEGMLEDFRRKLEAEPGQVRERVHLIHSAVFAADWPIEQDVVILGGNCFYEMCSSDEQRALVHRAAASVRPGGHVFIDNDDHQSTELKPSWRNPLGRVGRGFPSGTCRDGTVLEATSETLWYDVRCRLIHYVRRLKVTSPGGEVSNCQWQETCHPVIMAEVLAWAKEAGLLVEQTFGDKKGSPYSPDSPRCLVWARRPVQS